MLRIGLVGYGTGGRLDHFDLPDGRTDVGFTITLRHENGAHSHLSASKPNHVDCRELRAYGDKGAYVSSTTVVQAQDIFAGRRPIEDLNGWGREPEANWGTHCCASGRFRIPSKQGRYHDYYEAFATAARTGAAAPVTADEGARTLAVLDAARRSAAENRSIIL